MTGATDEPRLDRSWFERPVTEVAPDLLGRVVVTGAGAERVAVRLTEVEAYDGPEDPASHAFRGRTARTAVMFGPGGHLYCYFVYGVHWCANVVTGEDGRASAVLLRAGEVVDGHELARARLGKARPERHLARGPAALATVLGWDGRSTGLDLCDPTGDAAVMSGSPPPPDAVAVGPRVGVGVAAEVPWRFWLRGDPSVSAYRAGGRRRAAARTAVDDRGRAAVDARGTGSARLAP